MAPNLRGIRVPWVPNSYLGVPVVFYEIPGKPGTVYDRPIVTFITLRSSMNPVSVGYLGNTIPHPMWIKGLHGCNHFPTIVVLHERWSLFSLLHTLRPGSRCPFVSLIWLSAVLDFQSSILSIYIPRDHRRDTRKSLALEFWPGSGILLSVEASIAHL